MYFDEISNRPYKTNSETQEMTISKFTKFYKNWHDNPKEKMEEKQSSILAK